ncbi:hypothetical protein [Ewingella americana]|uniref:hypothetical protein n=1 Tax=Ewingella americana TaxID=41202 RepID=UPI0013867172|nr:hypothetical protein [Ewingella americana]
MKWDVVCINSEGKTQTVQVDVKDSTQAKAEAKRLGFKPVKVKTPAYQSVATTA